MLQQSKKSKPLIEGLADYIADNYGSCSAPSPCRCLKTGWIGRKCENWHPVKAKDWEELMDEMKP